MIKRYGIICRLSAADIALFGKIFGLTNTVAIPIFQKLVKLLRPFLDF